MVRKPKNFAADLDEDDDHATGYKDDNRRIEYRPWGEQLQHYALRRFGMGTDEIDYPRWLTELGDAVGRFQKTHGLSEFKPTPPNETALRQFCKEGQPALQEYVTEYVDTRIAQRLGDAKKGQAETLAKELADKRDAAISTARERLATVLSGSLSLSADALPLFIEASRPGHQLPDILDPEKALQSETGRQETLGARHTLNDLTGPFVGYQPTLRAQVAKAFADVPPHAILDQVISGRHHDGLTPLGGLAALTVRSGHDFNFKSLWLIATERRSCPYIWSDVVKKSPRGSGYFTMNFGYRCKDDPAVYSTQCIERLGKALGIGEDRMADFKAIYLEGRSPHDSPSQPSSNGHSRITGNGHAGAGGGRY